jgi:hypothetical protein
VLSARPNSEQGVDVVLLGDDGQSYDLTVNADCIGKLIRKLQSAASLLEILTHPTMTLHDVAQR